MPLFKIIYWAAIIAEIIIRAPFDRQRRKEKVSERRAGVQEQILLGLITMCGLLLPLIYTFSHWLDFANYTLPIWMNWFGVVLAVGAVLVFWRGHVDLGVHWSPTLEMKENHVLVTHGIYSVIRHPMYASQWLFGLAQALLLTNWLAGFLGLLVVFPFYFLRVSAEEKMMLDSFGDQYAEYMKKTGRIFPKLG